MYSGSSAGDVFWQHHVLASHSSWILLVSFCQAQESDLTVKRVK